MKISFRELVSILLICLLPFSYVSADTSLSDSEYRKVEALGAYLMAVAMAEHIKGSNCGFALPSSFNWNKEFRTYLQYFNYKTRSELKKDIPEFNIMSEAGREVGHLYKRINRTAPDDNTACGVLVGAVMSEVSHSKRLLDELVK